MIMTSSVDIVIQFKLSKTCFQHHTQSILLSLIILILFAYKLYLFEFQSPPTDI